MVGVCELGILPMPATNQECILGEVQPTKPTSNFWSHSAHSGVDGTLEFATQSHIMLFWDLQSLFFISSFHWKHFLNLPKGSCSQHNR